MLNDFSMSQGGECPNVHSFEAQLTVNNEVAVVKRKRGNGKQFRETQRMFDYTFHQITASLFPRLSVKLTNFAVEKTFTQGHSWP